MTGSVELPSDSRTRIRKTLSRNDVGATGSHQAGIAVPFSLVGFFPQLDETRQNPDSWILVEDDSDGSWSWRFLHYNNALFNRGTRNEHRLTHTTDALRSLGARAGDEIELERIGDRSYRARLVVAGETRPGVLVLSIDGPWRTVAIPRR